MTIMTALISAIITILVQVFPSLLDWLAKESAKPDKEIKDDAPAPKTTRDWFADKIRNHPGYKAHLEKKKP